MGYTRNTGQLSYLITNDGSGNITIPAAFTQGSVTSSVLKADAAGKLVAATAGTDYVAPAGLSAYVPTTRTLTINGTAYDLSADRSWTIVSGVSSFNTRTGAITLTSSDVTTALTFTPVTNARTLTINGTAYDLSADRSWSIVAGLSSFNTRTGAITLLDTDVTGALGYTPVTNARTITINGTAYDLSANRTWTVDTSSATTRVVQKFTATASQATFTITGGYTVGMVDVFLNGIKLDNATEFSAVNGSSVGLTVAAALNDIVEVYKYGGQFIANNTLRQTTAFTATAGQQTFTVNYSVGFVDVFYNGSKLAASEFTASTGTSILLATACVLNDIVEVVAYNYTVGAFTGVGGSGTTGTISKWTATGTLNNSIISENSNEISINSAFPTLIFNGSRDYALQSNDTSGSFRIIDNTAGLERISITSAGATTFAGTGNGVPLIIQDISAAITGQTGGYIGMSTSAFSGNNGDLVLYPRTSATSKILLMGGNVGIGTASPGGLLAVQGASATDGFGLFMGGAGNTLGGIKMGNTGAIYGSLYFDNNSNNVLLYQQYVTGSLVFGTNSTEKMRITSAGIIQKYITSITTYSELQHVIVASGGNTTATTTTNGATYKIHTFTSTGTFTVYGYGLVEILVVAGGGGGGYDVGGGGGAGGYVETSTFVNPGTYTITIGAGGGAGSSVGGTAGSGVSSTALGIIALGGGGGGNYSGGQGASGANGGGGAGYSGGYLAGGAGTFRQGNVGGAGRADLYATGATGGGGGGAATGGSQSVNNIVGFATGGDGVVSFISGSSSTYCKGGNGGGDSWTGMIDSPANTGYGGDGTGNTSAGKAGASGIVIIRYKV